MQWRRIFLILMLDLYIHFLACMCSRTMIGLKMSLTA